MGWTHCNAAIQDSDPVCPVCGIEKSAWTVQVEATRTFRVSMRGRAKQARTSWVEVALDGGKGLACEVELPDGQVIARPLDADGKLRIDELYLGECRVRFPGVPAWWSGSTGSGAVSEPTDQDRAQHAAEADGWIPCPTDQQHRFLRPVRIVWPEAKTRPPRTKGREPEETHWQWVNLPSSPEHEDHGSVLRARIHVGGGPGHPVHVRLAPAEGAVNSKRNVPLPGIAGRPAGETCVVYSGADGEARVEVELGRAGGDRWTLHVGHTAACADHRVDITNWRMLRAQITRRKEHRLPDMSLMEESLDEVFVKLEMMPPVLLEEGDERLPPWCWLDAPELKRGKLLNSIKNSERPLQKLFDAKAGGPSGVHFIVVDETYEVPLTDGVPELELGFEQTVTAQGTTFNQRKAGMKSNTPELSFFSTRLKDGASSFLEGTWKSLVPDEHAAHPDHGREEPLTLGELTFTPGEFSVRLKTIVPGDGKPPRGHGPTDAATKHPVRVTVKLSAIRRGNLGQAVGKHLMLRFQNDGFTTPRDWCTLLLHELGHALNQAGTYFPPGMDPAGHGRLYERKGHSGHHCADGLDDAAYGSGSYVDSKGNLIHHGTCLMFGDAVDANLRFCERCKPYVRADDCHPGIRGPA